MKTLNDVILSLKFNPDYEATEGHDEILNIFAPHGWLSFDDNKRIFNEYAKRNCWVKFDDGTIIRYEDEWPVAILTHFKYKL